MPNADTVTFTKRIERVLISIAENPSATIQERLDAATQLIRIKQVKPKTRVKRKPKTQDASMERLSNVLGGKV